MVFVYFSFILGFASKHNVKIGASIYHLFLQQVYIFMQVRDTKTWMWNKSYISCSCPMDNSKCSRVIMILKSSHQALTHSTFRTYCSRTIGFSQLNQKEFSLKHRDKYDTCIQCIYIQILLKEWSTYCLKNKWVMSHFCVCIDILHGMRVWPLLILK